MWEYVEAASGAHEPHDGDEAKQRGSVCVSEGRLFCARRCAEWFLTTNTRRMAIAKRIETIAADFGLRKACSGRDDRKRDNLRPFQRFIAQRDADRRAAWQRAEV
jgi:hypothetical protein